MGRSRPSTFSLSFLVAQEHLQGLRKQYRGRVEAMRGQVQQLTARHEACKKELAGSETVSEVVTHAVRTVDWSSVPNAPNVVGRPTTGHTTCGCCAGIFIVMIIQPRSLR